MTKRRGHRLTKSYQSYVVTFVLIKRTLPLVYFGIRLAPFAESKSYIWRSAAASLTTFSLCIFLAVVRLCDFFPKGWALVKEVTPAVIEE